MLQARHLTRVADEKRERFSTKGVWVLRQSDGQGYELWRLFTGPQSTHDKDSKNQNSINCHYPAIAYSFVLGSIVYCHYTIKCSRGMNRSTISIKFYRFSLSVK